MSSKSLWIDDIVTLIVRIAVFAAVAAALYLGAQSFYNFELSTMLQSNEASSEQVAEVNVTGQPAAANTDSFPIEIQPLYNDRDLTLSGVPAYGRMSFLLPLEANVSDARAKLDLRSEVPESVYATLRVSINGTRRLETVLPTGIKETSIRIDLKPEDLTRNTLEVSFAIIGNSTINICSAEQPANVVRFLPSSHLEVSSQVKELSLMDRYRAAGGLLGMPWSVDSDDTAAAQLLIASRAIKADVPLTFTAANVAGFTADEISSILNEIEQSPRNAAQPSWPLSFVSDSNDGGARIFTGRTNWRYQYSIKNLPDNRLPGKFHYAVRLGPMMDNDGQTRDWMLWFRVNGRLLGTRTAGEGVVEGSFDLHNDNLVDDNIIEISVGRPFGVDGVCNPGPPYIAELLPSTRLEAGEQMIADQTGRLSVSLGSNPHINVTGLSGLTPSMALAAADLLADLPMVPTLSKAGEIASRQIQIVRPSGLVADHATSQVYYHEGKQGRLDNLSMAVTRSAFQNSNVILLISNSASTHGENKPVSE